MRDIFLKKVEPCTNQEINYIEDRLNIKFPLAYKEFLLWGGKKAGGLMEGSDCFFENIELNQDTAKLILEEDNFPGSLPQSSLVFFMHQDYYFLFFDTSHSDDPPVYSYQENQSNNSFKLEYFTYTSFLIDILEKEAAWRKEW